ncbi:hypothetical protein KAU19_07940 [Candidatus Parcubacteria bacterium]|nr:hypothetical protein [Candidatus Parcubacteria bacterium]
MSKIAIDVVLLPNEEMTDKAIEVSKKQSEKYNDKILLNQENCLPHVSLAMGVINKNDIKKVSRILDEIVSQFTCFKLNVDSYRSPIIPSGDIVSEFSVEKTNDLQNLHVMIMDKLKQYLIYDVSIDMVYSPPKVEELTLHWIKGYSQNSSYDKFRPHITLGFGKEKNIITPIAFTASVLALCYLGNYCTCRKVLYSIKLNK